ncbi:DUF3806 domain-containing protein [Cellulomonas oligotrophica]|uniref:DUF3806 domain-containing protein n=1 Tax=Cellulomonas oligotrophica TaxID=931536 RepID=A0A7Y9FGU8_9CELL|nr:DUF3806 domain-containing protein [Cellulomonas oligotrophica]NYD87098.1 hypothetical protein [Cellulomonas oligotrophica]GIG32116.1 hypothetical protein Col01nite_12750 [Cellulomonas oligotrophica]
MGVFEGKGEGDVVPRPHGPADGELLPDGPEGAAPSDEDAGAPVDGTDDDGTIVDGTDDDGASDDAAEPAGPAVPDANAAAEPVASPDWRTVEPLNAAEQVWLAQQRTLLHDLCDAPLDADAVAALFDRVHAQWSAADDRPDPEPLGKAFGVAMGDLIASHLPGLRWCVRSDQYGTDIVLVHDEPEVVVYPLAAVTQQWESAAPGWFAAHLERVERGVRDVLAPHA